MTPALGDDEYAARVASIRSIVDSELAQAI